MSLASPGAQPAGVTHGVNPDRLTLVRNIRQLLTLHGASGPRRGAAMSELNVISGGAVLLRNGIIEETGRASRIESLAAARHAEEVDAGGMVVMPAFVDADTELVVPPPLRGRARTQAGIHGLSEEIARKRADAVARGRVRQGCLSVGSRTACAGDLRNTLKILRVQRALQGRPLRIRSVYSYRPATALSELTGKWLPAIRKDKLATVMEFSVDGDTGDLREAADAAATAGIAIRVRSASALSEGALQFALSCGAISIVAPLDGFASYLNPLANIGCVRVVPVAEGDDGGPPWLVREAIDSGASVALACGGRSNLRLAVERLGMTTEEAIVAATYNAACSLRLSHSTGSIEPGKSADLLFVDVRDYRDLLQSTADGILRSIMRAGTTLPGTAH